MAPKEVIGYQCSVISAHVVARSPDRATRSTEGLHAPLNSGDLRSNNVRGQETRAQRQETRAQRRRTAPARDRRGVLILVVLSLLILFVVIAVMFVVVASRARAVARVYSNVGRTGDTPEEIVYGVALDLIRGSLNPHSPFRTTSLLEDMYGHQSVRGKVTAAASSVVPSGAGSWRSSRLIRSRRAARQFFPTSKTPTAVACSPSSQDRPRAPRRESWNTGRPAR
jgi:hypothetical protein